MISIWINLGEALGCGGCGEITTVRSPFTCKECGRMLCGDCGSLCKDHPLTKPAEDLPKSRKNKSVRGSNP